MPRPKFLDDPTARKALVDDAVRLVEGEVQKKKGLAGIALKATFSLVTSVRPGFLGQAVDFLLGDFAAALEPVIDQAAQGGLSVSQAVSADPARTASLLLTSVDRRAAQSQNATARKAYDKLRGTAQAHVEEAVPALAQLIQRHWTT